MQAAQIKAYEVGTVLYMAMELSNSKWKLGFDSGDHGLGVFSDEPALTREVVDATVEFLSTRL